MIYLKNKSINQINKLIKDDAVKFINQCEDEFNKKVASVVDYIKENKIEYVFVSGPTSSGKTTFSERFKKYFAEGKYFDVSLDDYFKPIACMPKRKNGDYNFESVNSLKLPELVRDLKKIKNGEEVYVPQFDFMTLKCVEKSKKIKSGNGNLVVIEGLHALNSKIFDVFKEEKTLRIFICPMPEIYRDNAKISSYDLRFIRRLVRDYNYRNADIFYSLELWESVRLGEKVCTGRYMKNAHIFINTFLDYEPCVLKKEALPLLEKVTEDNKYYRKSVRLKNILNEFEETDRKLVPSDSLLNEFIKKD